MVPRTAVPRVFSPYPGPLLPLRQVAGAKGISPCPLLPQRPVSNRGQAWVILIQPYPLHQAVHPTDPLIRLNLKDIYVVLGSTTIPEEQQAIWMAAKTQADQRHFANPSPERPPGAQTVPDADPNWDYQETGMVECLLGGMEATSIKWSTSSSWMRSPRTPTKTLLCS